MFEARLAQGKVLKMIVEAMKDLVTDANLDAAAGGLSLQVCTCTSLPLRCFFFHIKRMVTIYSI